MKPDGKPSGNSFGTQKRLATLRWRALCYLEEKMTTALDFHTEQHGSFDLAFSAENAFPLFSPEGERIWVPGWTPIPVFPADMVVRWQTDAVFTLERGGELLTWWIVEVDQAAHRASYVYFAPGRVVRVNVNVASTGAHSCRVNVIYVITATSAEGERHVTEGCAMDSKMKEWKRLIETSLAGREVPKVVQ